MSMVPADKTATVIVGSGVNEEEQPADSFEKFRKYTRGTHKDVGVDRRSLGTKTIDGKQAIGFELRDADARMILWGNPESGLPVRVEISVDVNDTKIKIVMTDFKFDVELDEALFDTKPPAGYRVNEIPARPDPRGE